MQAWHKAQKAAAIKKSKSTQQKERTEKLARRNPERLQRQVDELTEAIAAGQATAHNRKLLAEAEKDLAAVRKARKALGIEDKEPISRKRARHDNDEGKRRERVEDSDSGESTASSVAEIPMPPGPLPPLPGEPKIEVRTTYESAPVLRDLKKEAAAFVPVAVAVKRKLEAQKAEAAAAAVQEDTAVAAAVMPRVNAAPEVDVDEEIRRFHVEVEEAEDDGR